MRSNLQLTDYDLAVRAVSENKTNLFINKPNSLETRKSRAELVEFVKYYRKPKNLEEYHAKHFKIQTKKDGIIPFKWKPAQRTLFHQSILPRLVDGTSIDIYILKARQIGFSTLIEAIGSAYAALYSDFRASVIAHDVETSSKIHEMCKLYIKSIPERFRPASKISNKKELMLSNPRNDDPRLGLESSFTVKTARNKHLGAGHTLRFLHLSELARYEEVNPDAMISLTTLFNALPSNTPFTFRLIETTAYGEGIGKRFWDDEKNGFEKVFISWIAEEEYTLLEPVTEELNYSSDHPYGDEITARDHILKELKYWYPDRSYDEEWLKYESLCRLNWRRQSIDEKHFGDISLFNQEFPLTPEEAFLATGKCVFDMRVLSNLEEAVNVRTEEIPKFSYVPPARNADNAVDFGKLIKAPLGELKIYEAPIPGYVYNLGVDCSAALQDGDYQAIQVTNERYRQSASYKGYLEADDLARLIALLSFYYNNATAVIEANTYGVSVINFLVKEILFTKLYQRERFNSVDNQLVKEWGFYTSPRTRPLLLDLVRSKLGSGELILRDLDTIIEFKNFKYMVKKKKIKMEAAPGFNDDLVMAQALSMINLENDLVKEEEYSEDNPPVGSVEYYAQLADDTEDTGLFRTNVVGIF